MSTSVRRWYTELKPSHYELLLVPDAAAMTFRGTVTVRLHKTGRPSRRLTFHQQGLRIDHAQIIKLDKKGPHELAITRINSQDSLDEIRLHTGEMVYAGEYEVHMDFHGTITRTMTGLYPCFFTHEGMEHMLLATQLESHYARQLFPCIDEPEAKAVFHLSLVAPSGHVVLSNTPIEQQETYTGEDEPAGAGSPRQHITFAPTPKMSTYLLAFVMGELHGAHTTTARGTQVSAWATISQPAGALDFALDTAKRSIEFFEDYFGTQYPLPKADHVALPDFSFGAMENWGLITYRERMLLAYPGETGQSTQETIAAVIAHETSHQWFGNLVTMRWWDQLWLNESFANLMEYQAVDAMFPAWHIWDEFVMNEGLSSLRRDASPKVQAVQTAVHSPEEIDTIFDPSIVYAKGGRLLYMLKTYIGEDAFRRGLSSYFARHAYSNTTGADLWQALQAASGVDVAAFMNPWLEQAGFPVVTLEQDGRKVSITQAHFLEDGQQSDGRLWPIPLFAHHPGLPERLDKAALRRTLATDEPVRLDQHAAGHYIVRYARPEQRAHLAELVRTRTLGIADRLMLLNNASMLAKAGAQPFADVLRLLEAYRNEQAEAVWGIVALIIAEARRFVDLDESLEAHIKQFVRALVQQEYARLGWDETPQQTAADRKLRADIIALGVYAGESAIVREALARFQAYHDGSGSLHEELRGIVFGAAIRQDTPDAFAFLLKLHDDTANSGLKMDIMAGLTLTRNAAQASTLLNRLPDARLVKPQDADYWLAYLLRNRFVRTTAWEWMVDNWGWIEATYAHDKSYDIFPRYAAGICNTPEWADKYAALFVPKQAEPALKRNIAIGLAEIATRVAWLQRDLPGVKAFFAR